MKDGMEEGQKEEAEHKRNRGRVAGREKGMRERKKCRTEPYEQGDGGIYFSQEKGRWGKSVYLGKESAP